MDLERFSLQKDELNLHALNKFDIFRNGSEINHSNIKITQGNPLLLLVINILKYFFDMKISLDMFDESDASNQADQNPKETKKMEDVFEMWDNDDETSKRLSPLSCLFSQLKREK